MRQKTWDHIHPSVISPVFLCPFSHCWEMYSLHSFLVHILCKHLHALLGFREVLRLFFLQSVVLCNANVQAFGAIVHLVLLIHEPMFVQDVLLVFTSLPLSLQLLLHHLLSFLLDTLGLGHIQMQPLFILHLVQRWREYSSSILEHIAHLSSSIFFQSLACMMLLHLLLWGIYNHPQVSPYEMIHAQID